MSTNVSRERMQLEDDLALAEALESKAAATGVIPYLKRVVIDCRPEPRPFGDVADQWQWDDLAQLAPRLEYLAGLRTSCKAPRCYWRTRPRGHDKTSSIARVVNWLLAFSRRKVQVAVGAADKDQAQLLLEAASNEAQHNPWIKDRVSYQSKQATGPGGRLRVLESDAKSAYGLLSDVYIADELTHWKSRDLWNALWSGRHKRPGSMFLVITNAGEKDSWQEEILKSAKRNTKLWSVSEAPINKTLASWMTPEDIAATEAMLPPGLAARVIWNRWTDPTEGRGYLTLDLTGPCVVPGLIPIPSAGERVWLSVDYAPLKDRTVMAAIRLNRTARRFEVMRLDILTAEATKRVQIADLEDWIDRQMGTYPNRLVVLDPYQMESTAQKLENRGVEVKRFEARGGKSNYELAEKLRSAVVNRQLAWRPDQGSLPNLNSPSGWETFEDELVKLVLKVTPYGYRIDHESGRHDDRAVAVGMALVEALEDPQVLEWVGPGKPVAEAVTEPVTALSLARGSLLEPTPASLGRKQTARRRGDFRRVYGK